MAILREFSADFLNFWRRRKIKIKTKRNFLTFQNEFGGRGREILGFVPLRTSPNPSRSDHRWQDRDRGLGPLAPVRVDLPHLLGHAHPDHDDQGVLAQVIITTLVTSLIT